MHNPLDFSGKTIVVTGASSGIGKAIAEYLAGNGARIVLLARNESRLDATAAGLDGSGHLAKSVNLNEVESIPALLKAISAVTGPIQGLVHSAGMHFLKPLRVQDPVSLRELLTANVESAIALAKGFRVKGVRAEDASLVFLSSVVGHVGQPGAVAYSASKGAIDALTRTLALELAPELIRVNSIAPAVVWTEMTEKLKGSLPEENWLQILKMHPLGLGQPSDIAHAAAFLLSPASRWITGTTLRVDGGYSAH